MSEPIDDDKRPDEADEPAPAYADLVGREVDVLHRYDPDRGGDGMVAYRGVLLEVTDRGLTLDGNDRDDYDDDRPPPHVYRALVPWGGFLRVEEVDQRPV